MKSNYYKVVVGSMDWVTNCLHDDGDDKRAEALLDMVAYDGETDLYYHVVSTLEEYFDFLDELWELLGEDFNIEVDNSGLFIDFN